MRLSPGVGASLAVPACHWRRQRSVAPQQCGRTCCSEHDRHSWPCPTHTKQAIPPGTWPPARRARRLGWRHCWRPRHYRRRSASHPPGQTTARRVWHARSPLGQPKPRSRHPGLLAPALPRRQKLRPCRCSRYCRPPTALHAFVTRLHHWRSSLPSSEPPDWCMPLRPRTLSQDWGRCRADVRGHHRMSRRVSAVTTATSACTAAWPHLGEMRWRRVVSPRAQLMVRRAQFGVERAHQALQRLEFKRWCRHKAQLLMATTSGRRRVHAKECEESGRGAGSHYVPVTSQGVHGSVEPAVSGTLHRANAEWLCKPRPRTKRPARMRMMYMVTTQR